MIAVLGREFHRSRPNGVRVMPSKVSATIAGMVPRSVGPAYTVRRIGRDPYGQAGFVNLTDIAGGHQTVFKVTKSEEGSVMLDEALTYTKLPDGTELFNGGPADEHRFPLVGHLKEIIKDGKSVESTGPIGPFQFLSIIRESTVVLWGTAFVNDGENRVTVYYQKPTPGEKVMRPAEV